MKTRLHFAFLLCCSAFPLHATDALLFRMPADADGNASGMVFQEVERSDTSSTIELLRPAGSAAAKSLFLLRGACALAKERAQQAFTIEPLSRQPVRFALRFATAEAAERAAPGRATSEGGVVPADLCNRLQSMMRK